MWQAEYQGFPTYPVTGGNIGYSGHLYPFSNSFDNPTAFNTDWNTGFAACANFAPMIFTELCWDPNNANTLVDGTTAGFGTNIKTTFDASGNISWSCGMTVDVIGNMTAGLSNITFTTEGGPQTCFGWFPLYTGQAPGTVATGTYEIVSLNSGLALDAINQGTVNGTQLQQWSYWGGQGQQWNVTSLGYDQYSILGVQSGRSIDINNWGTANGTVVQLWDYFNNSNQTFSFVPTANSNFEIIPLNAPGSCLDVANISTSPGAIIQLWSYWGGLGQQWSFHPVGSTAATTQVSAQTSAQPKAATTKKTSRH